MSEANAAAVIVKDPAVQDPPKAAAVAAGDAKALGSATPEAVAAKPAAVVADAKPAAVVAAPKVPEKYDLKVPEGAFVDSKAVERIASLSKKRGLTNDQAQELLNEHADSVGAFVKDGEAELSRKSDSWQQEVKADKEFGGEKLPETLEDCKRALGRFADPEFAKLLGEIPMGNYPGLVKTFARIGRAMKEDKLVTSTGGPAPIPKRAADLLYGGAPVSNKRG